MSNQRNYNVRKIYDLEFSLDFKGYAPQEVDSVLDQVMADYLQFDQLETAYQTALTELKQQLAQKEATIIELQSQLKAKVSSAEDNPNQVDLMKRIARLEALVYNKDQ